MRVMKFAVVLCFTVALVMLGNYPPSVTVHGAAPKALPRLAKDSTPAYTYMNDVSAVICANCHQTINHNSFWDAIEIECEDCHGSGGHGMVGATSAYHNSFGTPEGSCKDCHTTGGGGFEGATPAYHNSFGGPEAPNCTSCHNMGGVDGRASSAYHKSFGPGWPMY
jgi:hypothetical protein